MPSNCVIHNLFGKFLAVTIIHLISTIPHTPIIQTLFRLIFISKSIHPQSQKISIRGCQVLNCEEFFHLVTHRSIIFCILCQKVSNDENNTSPKEVLFHHNTVLILMENSQLVFPFQIHFVYGTLLPSHLDGLIISYKHESGIKL